MTATPKSILKVIATVIGVATLLVFIYLIRSVIIYVLISAVIALIGKPLVDKIMDLKIGKKNINSGIAAALTLFIIIGVLALVMSIFIPSIVQEIELLSQLDLEKLLASVDKSLQKVPGNKFSLQNSKGLIIESLLQAFNFSSISNTFSSVIGGMGNMLFALFSILFITFFFLKEKHLFKNIVLAIVPNGLEKNILSISPRLQKTLSRYFIGLLIQICIVTIMVFIGLSLIGYTNVLAIALFAGLINVIPYLGPILGFSFAMVLGLSANLSTGGAIDPLQLSLFTLLVFSIVQLTDNFALQPLIFSNSINAHPLEIFLVISIAAVLTGIAGMIVAVPTYSVIRVLAKEFFPHIKFIQKLTQNVNTVAHNKSD